MKRLCILLLLVCAGNFFGAASSSSSSAAASSSSSGGPSYFAIESGKLQRRIDGVLHPVLHGCAEEKKEGLWSSLSTAASEAGSKLWEGDFSGAYERAKGNQSLWQSLKTLAGGVVSKFVGEKAEKVLFHGGFYEGSEEEDGPCRGSLSLDAINAAESDIHRRFPDWNPRKTCPHGISNCLKLGHSSKAALRSIYAFFENIRRYETRVGQDFFSRADADRIFMFLANLTTQICERNILFAITSKESTAPDDSQLRPFLKVVNYLVALPTEFHDPLPSWKENQKEIDDLLSILPLKEQRNLYDVLNALADRATDPMYGHRSGDSSLFVLFSGSTGTGKTYVGKKLLELLGFHAISLTFDELRRGQESSYNELIDLVDEPEVSGLETKLLHLKSSRAKKGVASLNQLVFVDEVDEDRNFTISELKEQFDQFKKMYFPALGVTVPGFLNCIFTTNNKKLFKDPALISRFFLIFFPEMPAETKLKILHEALLSKIDRYPRLKSRYDFKKVLTKVVNFDDRINVRLLLGYLDMIIRYFQTKYESESGENFRIPVACRSGHGESFSAFLERKFDGLDLPPKSSDEDHSSEEDAIRGDDEVSKESEDEEDDFENITIQASSSSSATQSEAVIDDKGKSKASKQDEDTEEEDDEEENLYASYDERRPPTPGGTPPPKCYFRVRDIDECDLPPEEGCPPRRSNPHSPPGERRRFGGVCSSSETESSSEDDEGDDADSSASDYVSYDERRPPTLGGTPSPSDAYRITDLAASDLSPEKVSTPCHSNPASPWSSDDDEFGYGSENVITMSSSPSREEVAVSSSSSSSASALDDKGKGKAESASSSASSATCSSSSAVEDDKGKGKAEPTSSPGRR